MPNPQKQFNRALQLHQAGQIGEAIALYQAALPRMKKNPQLLFLLGTAQLQAGNNDDCIDLMKRALELEPDNVYAHINRGNALQNQGRLEEAVSAFDRALALNPDLPEVHNNRGAALLSLGRLEEALAAMDAALALNADYVEAHSNRGHALQGLGRSSEALAACERALTLNPDHAEAHNNKGVILLELNRAEEALAAFERALLLTAGYAEACNNRGRALEALERPEEALGSYEQALTLNPGDAEAYLNRGNALQTLRRPEEALALFEQALALDSGYAKAHNNRGAALFDVRRFEEAQAAYEMALALNPDDTDARVNRAVLLLLMGDYRQGWEQYEWRLKQDDGGYAFFPQPAWRGEADIAGKRILIQSEQGFGDIVQFCRYLPQLVAMGAEVIFEAPNPLLSLVATLDCPITLVAKGEALPDFDVYCPLMSLPYALGTTVETIPAEVPYLHADEARVAQWRRKLGSAERPRIGVVWSASTSRKNPHRSLPLADILPLIELPAEFHSLQVEYREHDLALLARHPEIRQHQHELSDFADTAALIACMDMVITVDTGVAHVAGAMGRPVWIMLPFAADYRWLLDRSDSPWYPTARLFQQSERGNWQGVVAEVASTLLRSSS